MSNLFLEAQTPTERSTFESIRKNKEFAGRLIDNLARVYKVFIATDHTTNGVTYTITRGQNYRGGFRFIADLNGVKFTGTVLGYRSIPKDIKTRIGTIGWIHDKYFEFGGKYHTNADFTHLDFVIGISDDGDDTMRETLRDIMRIMDFDRYGKLF